MKFEELCFTNINEKELEAKSTFGDFYIYYDEDDHVYVGSCDEILIEVGHESLKELTKQLQKEYHKFLKSFFNKDGSVKDIKFKKIKGIRAHYVTNDTLNLIWELSINYDEYEHSYMIDATYDLSEIFGIDLEEKYFETVDDAKEFFNNKFKELMKKTLKEVK